MSSFTASQVEAIEARGNVLVAAGAGTGKTRTLVERCIRLLLDPIAGAGTGQVLVVTFTEAAAAELRQRVREALLERQAADPANDWIATQISLLETANISTIHGFCLKLVRDHFHELSLDPQATVMGDGQDRLQMDVVFDELMEAHYAGTSDRADEVREFLDLYDTARQDRTRKLVFKLHLYTQTLPDPQGWMAEKLNALAQPSPDDWRALFSETMDRLRAEWIPGLEFLAYNTRIAECITLLRNLPQFGNTRAGSENALRRICELGSTKWPTGESGKIRDAVKDFWSEAAFLCSQLQPQGQSDPMEYDWNCVRKPMGTLLWLTNDFGRRFAETKRQRGLMDFHDLEQFTLRLLVEPGSGAPTPMALRLRDQFKFVFVDEYQDINAAQDAILQALAREGTEPNRFLVGDVKQSIYRFRLAAPHIFRRYQENWREASATSKVIHLSENFRSREGILNFTNAFFGTTMRASLGGVEFDHEAALRAGAVSTGNLRHRPPLEAAHRPSVSVQVLIKRAAGESEPFSGQDSEPGGEEPGLFVDLLEVEKEAQFAAHSLARMIEGSVPVWDDSTKVWRPVRWGDMAILLRGVRGRADAYARQFDSAGIPLLAPRAGFFESTEISDMLSLLQLMDNVLQDIPLLAVLRSPLAGLTLDEVVAVRLASPKELMWVALQQLHLRGVRSPVWTKVDDFLGRFKRWRRMAHGSSLSQRLEEVLEETHYFDWLGTQPRGSQRQSNVRRLLALARRFDPFQRQGLQRFLRYVKAQQEAGSEPGAATVETADAVRLLSIHSSKGLEFPVVLVAGLHSKFNTDDLKEDVILDERLGLCSRVKPRDSRTSWPSLPRWIASATQLSEGLGEELRLLYVAFTRARDHLILQASASENAINRKWTTHSPNSRSMAKGRNPMDWLGPWLTQQAGLEDGFVATPSGKNDLFSWEFVEPTELETARHPVGDAAGPVESSSRSPNHAAMRALRNRLEWTYPNSEATRIPAKSTVTFLRKQWMADEDARTFWKAKVRVSSTRSQSPKLTAAEAGLANHRFIECLDLSKAGSAAELIEELNRLTGDGTLTPLERDAVRLDAMSAFWASEPGRLILENIPEVQREIPFTARFPLMELEALQMTAFPTTGTEVDGGASRPSRADATATGEFIVVQGAVDLAVVLEKEIWILDFKTDTFDLEALPAKVEEYRPQILLYASALSKVMGRPVTRRWLHFLCLNETVTVP